MEPREDFKDVSLEEDLLTTNSPVESYSYLDYLEKDSEPEVDQFGERIYRPWTKRFFSPIGPGSLRGSVFSLLSITLGAGCLSLPYAIKCVGPVVGLLYFAVIGSVSYWTLKSLILAGRRMKRLSYNDLVTITMGEKMRIFTDINNLIFCYGVIMTYQYVISQFCHDLVSQMFNWVPNGHQSWFRFIQMFSFMLFFQIPLSLNSDIPKLRFSSVIGSFTLFYIIFLVAMECPFYFKVYSSMPDNDIEWLPSISFRYLDAYSVIGFGFAPHNGLFQSIMDLNKPTKNRMLKVLNSSFILLLIFYALIAYCGYFSTLKHTPSVFINRLDLPDYLDIPMMVGKVSMIICLHCIMAIIFIIFRESLIELLYKTRESEATLNIKICVITFISSNLMTFFIDDLVHIMNFIGGISITLISTFNPIMIDILIKGEKLTTSKNVLKILVCVVFSLLGIGATTKSFVDFIRSKLN